MKCSIILKLGSWISRRISDLFFWWIVPLIQLGRERELTKEDIYELPPEYLAAKLERKLSKNWHNELKTSNPNLVCAIWKTFKSKYLNCVVILGCRDLIIRVGQGLCLYLVLNEVDNGRWSGLAIFSGALIVILVYLNALTSRLCYIRSALLGLEIRVSLTTLIYRKVLRILHGESRAAEITNMLSNDVSRFGRYMFYMTYLFVAPSQFIVALVVLWIYMGTSALAGMALCLMVVPLQLCLGNLYNKLRHSCGKATDVRVRHTIELITGIQWMKTSTWELPFASAIGEAREYELKAFLRRSRLNVNFAIVELTMKLVQFLILLVYVLTGHSAVPQKVFVLMIFIVFLTNSFCYNFSSAVMGTFECIAAAQRIQKFLLMEDKECYDKSSPEGLVTDAESSVLQLINMSSSWTPNAEPFLFDITLRLEKGQLLGVIGPVGSGKSTLLKSILQEIRVTSGKLRIAATSIAYVSQEPWIFPATLLENLIFGKPYDEDWLRQVVAACALGRDVELMPNGINTFLGDRGITLSGGQKARVNLARAVYANADLYLLDDPLSGVDVSVAKIIMTDCVRGLLVSKAVILVTHQVHHLSVVNNVLVLKQGCVDNYGSFSDVKKNSLEADLGLSPENDVVDELEPEEYFMQQPYIETPTTQETQKAKHPNKGYGTFSTNQRLEDNETQTTGAIKFGLHWKYWSAGGLKLPSFLFFSYIVCQGFSSIADYWLKIWTNRAKTVSVQIQTSPESYDDLPNALTYVYIILGFGVAGICRNLLFFQITNNLSRVLHERMLMSIIRAPLRFFEINTTGRVLKRFVDHLGVVDDHIPLFYIRTSNALMQGVGAIVLISAVLPLTLIPAVILMVVFYKIRNFYTKSGSGLKRMEASAGSPVLAIFNFSISGIATIRASKSEDMMMREFLRLQDALSAAYYCYVSASKWFTFSLDCATATYVMLVFIYCFIVKPDTATTGLVMSSALALAIILTTATNFWADLENGIVSIERILEYCDVKSEAPPIIPGRRPPPSWPSSGAVQLDNCSVRYGRNPPILHSIKLRICPREKIGIVGRTGAGKSSLISSLFRLVELDSGSIHIDSVDISRMGLHDLRSKIAIISQTPVLLHGTLRKNLDPFGRCRDEQLMDILNQTDFAYRFQGESKNGLDTQISSGGENLSHGERQLICLARAMLENAKILILDEATAHVDGKTDSRIQATLRSKLKKKTVLVVAHRLSTVMDCDKILVLDDGKILEFDHPYILLQNPKGKLFELCQKAGPRLTAQFAETAKISFQCLTKNAPL